MPSKPPGERKPVVELEVKFILPWDVKETTLLKLKRREKACYLQSTFECYIRRTQEAGIL